MALDIDERISNTSSVRFDADSLTVNYDNSANVHICNSKSFFVGDIEMDASVVVANIGGMQNTSTGIGTVTGNGRTMMEYSTRLRFEMYFIFLNLLLTY